MGWDIPLEFIYRSNCPKLQYPAKGSLLFLPEKEVIVIIIFRQTYCHGLGSQSARSLLKLYKHVQSSQNIFGFNHQIATFCRGRLFALQLIRSSPDIKVPSATERYSLSKYLEYILPSISLNSLENGKIKYLIPSASFRQRTTIKGKAMHSYKLQTFSPRMTKSLKVFLYRTTNILNALPAQMFHII